MKNPIKHLKHMWKDPINTIDEANARKKEVLPWLITSIAIAVIPGVLGNVVPELAFLSIFSIIGVFGIMVFGFMLFIIKKAKAKFEALTCDKCNTMAAFKTPEEYAEFVSYNIVKNEATCSGASHPESKDGYVSQIEVKGSAFAVVKIDLKCPNCGNIKELRYSVAPFKCSIVQKKVHVKDVEMVKAKLENAVKEVVNDYNNLEQRFNIPYSIHSKKNPDYENRGKAQTGNSKPKYKGVTIDYHKDVEEMVDAFFLENQLDGTIVDPNKPKKSK